MRHEFRVTEGMRSKYTLTAAKAHIADGRKIILLHGIDNNGQCTCKSKDCSSPGKHPLGKFFPKGLKSATDDVGLIKRALKKHKNANLAITLKGLTVVDIDGPNGRATVKKLKLPKTAKVMTGRGTHRYFVGELRDGTFKAEEIDVLTGEGHMTLVPPSMHLSGKRYRYSGTASKRAVPTPQKLASIKPPIQGNKRLSPKKTPSALVIKRGERNQILFKAACHLRRLIHDDGAIEIMLTALNEQYCEDPLKPSELRSAINSSGNYVEDANELFGPPKGKTPLPMEWLWYPYFPLFGVTIIAGDPGMGKSLLLAKIIAAVTTGGTWPLSKDTATEGKVLLLSAEDNWQRVTLPRLLKNGANVDNLHVMQKFRALTDENLDKLAHYMKNERPRMVVIDTISAYMGSGRDQHRQNDVGEFLGRLTEMAEEYHSAIIAIGHLNKQSNEHPLYRIVGSIGFAASIRSALFYGTDPTDRSRFALAHGKANASEKGKTIIFEKSGGGRRDVPLLHAIEFSDANEAQVCRVDPNAVGRPPSASEAARELILEYLSDKPVKWEQVASNISRRNIASVGTLNSLRAEMAKNSEIIQLGSGRKARWILGKTQKQKP